MAQEKTPRVRVGKAAKTTASRAASEKSAPAKPAATKTGSRSRVPRTKVSPTSDAIALEAFLLWERGEPGDATEHWLRAERELAA